MILLTVTKTRKKGKLLLQIALLLLILAFAVPSIYSVMVTSGAMKNFSQPGEPMRVDAPLPQSCYWQDIAEMLEY